MKTHKTCKKCHVEKPIENFYVNTLQSSRKGRSWNPRCKDCVNEIKRDKHKENPDIRRNFKLKYSYGITLEEYNQKLKEQNNLCAICKSDKSGGNGNFYVDHNHTTGQVRGLLCHWCNFMIGQCKEDPEILSAGIDYLKKWSQS